MTRPGLRLQVRGPTADEQTYEIGDQAQIGGARAADVPLPEGNLPKVVALLAATADGFELIFHDHPQGGITVDEGLCEHLALSPGVSFTLAPYSFTVLSTVDLPATPTSSTQLTDQADSGTPRGTQRRRRKRLFLLVTIVSTALVTVGLTLAILWLANQSPTPDPTPTHTATTTVKPAPPPPPEVVEVVREVVKTDPNLVNILIVLPRTDLAETDKEAVTALAEQLQSSIAEDPNNIRTEIAFDAADTVYLHGLVPYQRVRKALREQQNVIIERLPQVLDLGPATPLPGALGWPPAPWPLAIHLSGQGAASALAISTIQRIALDDLDTWSNEEVLAISRDDAEVFSEVEFHTGQYRFIFAYLPADVLAEPAASDQPDP